MLPEWQQFIQSVVRPGGQFFQGIFEPGMRVKAVESGGADEGLNGGGAFARTLRSGEQPIFLAHGNRSDGVFDWVVVDGQMSGFCIADECRPAFEGVVHGFGGAAAGCDLLAGDCQPVVEFDQDRVRLPA